MKAHTGIEGNEVADTLTKEVAQDDEERNIVYDRIPISTIATGVKEKGFKKWQTQWERAEKGALCRSFFPTVEQRLKIQIPITPEFTAIVSGHGKTKSYVYRFKLIDKLMCPCNEGEQSVEHLIHACRILEPQRSSLIQHITTRGGIWPPSNNELVAKYLNAFSRFVKPTDSANCNRLNKDLHVYTAQILYIQILYIHTYIHIYIHVHTHINTCIHTDRQT